MGRIIKLEVGQKTYTLEFNRRTLLLAGDIQARVQKAKTAAEQFSVLCDLIRVAFLKNHPDISQQEVDEVIEHIDDLDGFTKALTEILEASVDVLKSNKGNAHWEVN